MLRPRCAHGVVQHPLRYLELVQQSLAQPNSIDTAILFDCVHYSRDDARTFAAVQVGEFVPTTVATSIVAIVVVVGIVSPATLRLTIQACPAKVLPATAITGKGRVACILTRSAFRAIESNATTHCDKRVTIELALHTQPEPVRVRCALLANWALTVVQTAVDSLVAHVAVTQGAVDGLAFLESIPVDLRKLTVAAALVPFEAGRPLGIRLFGLLFLIGLRPARERPLETVKTPSFERETLTALRRRSGSAHADSLALIQRGVAAPARPSFAIEVGVSFLHSVTRYACTTPTRLRRSQACNWADVGNSVISPLTLCDVA